MKHKKKKISVGANSQLPKPTRKVALVVSAYNEEITSKLAAGAHQTLSQAGVSKTHVDEFVVPGAWELPLAVRWLCDTGRYSCVIALGVVIKGETSHDQHINRFVSMSLGQLSLNSGIPVAFGLLTCETLSQAQQRAGGKVGNKGCEAAEAALAMLQLRQTING